MDDWIVYLIRCKDDSLYCGVTNNLDKRIATHNSGKGAKYTSPRLPVVLVVASGFMSRSAALKLEYKVKRQEKHLKINYLRMNSK